MAVLVPNDIWQVRIYCSLQTQLAVNVLHYRVASTTGTLQTDAALAARLEALFQPLYDPLVSNAAIIRGVGVQRIHPQPPTVEIYSDILGGTGSGIGDPLPKQVCGVITKRTASAGRAYRGRMYVPFPTEDMNSPDTTPSGAYLGALTNLANQVEALVVVGAGLNIANCLPVLYHRIDGSTTDLEECTANDRWGTQRRRGDYGRVNTFPF